MKELSAEPYASVPVGVGDAGYEVRIGAGLLSSLPEWLRERAAHRVAVLSDSNVGPLHAGPLVDRLAEAGVEAELFTFPAGEASKTRKSWSILTDELLDAGFGRDSRVVAVGGGVTTDLAGFVAATFMRGIGLVQAPTSYLAMIDASVGGKTGVDVRHGKNLVGAFHRPEIVVADTAALATLPREERAEGLIEAVKHGAILDAAYFTELVESAEALLDADPASARTTVVRSVELKSGVVTEDEREAGLRQILNFGHTIGHAIEAASDFALGHGSAVALGMVAEARLGEAVGITEAGTADRLAHAAQAVLGALEPSLDVERVEGYLGADKKVRRGRPRYVLLEAIGRVAPGEGWTHEVPDALVTEVLRSL